MLTLTLAILLPAGRGRFRAPLPPHDVEFPAGWASEQFEKKQGPAVEVMWLCTAEPLARISAVIAN